MSEFDLLKKFAVSDILSVSGKDKASHTINKHLNSAYELGCVHSNINQQKKIDAVLHFIDNIDTIDIENDVVLRNTVYEIQELLK